ncbi:MAG: phage holin family protein [Isosphaeraceae bacterium]|nr:phage holin family protein [Isosphaeraceae bacterium]
MAYQASVNGGARVPIHAPIAGGIIDNLAEFGNDIITLAELQARLAIIDLKESTARATWPAVGLVSAGALALGSIPVLLFGVAELLAWGLKIHLGWALLLTALVVLALAGLAGFVCGRLLSGSFESFRRSREELRRNAAWIKTVLLYSGRSSAPSRR